MTKSAKIFFLVYILASVTALICSQLQAAPSHRKPQSMLPASLTMSVLGDYAAG